MPLPTPQEALESFEKAFPSGAPYREYTKADDERLTGRIPDVMRMILKKDGWCSYREQIFWMCDPDDWIPAARAWFPESTSAQVLGRSSFGDLFVLDKCYWLTAPHRSVILQSTERSDWFFGETVTSKRFMLQADLPEHRAAQKAAGPLEWDEMYTYEPTLARGGTMETSKVERVKAREQLVILAQLAPIRRR
jgi:hypothetical protein